MGKTLKERLNKLPAARRAKVDARAAELLAEEMSLKDLRKARELTQEHMAELLGIGQEGISRLEKRSDLLISTLRNYVARMGGRIELVVRFPDRPAVLLQDLAELSTAEPKSPAPKKSSNGLRRGQHTPEAGRIRQTSNLQWLFLVSRSDETHINDGACVYQLQLYHSKTPDSTAVSTHRPTHDYAEVAASSSAPA